MSREAREARDRTIVETMRTGLSREDASVLTDCSKHAFDQAFETAKRIIDSAPDHLKIATLASVLASFATILRETFPGHWAAFVATETDREEGTVIVLDDAAARSVQ